MTQLSPTQLMLDPKSLKPNPWNVNSLTPDAEDKLEASIRRLGMFKPVVVRSLPDGNKQILGGAHRALMAIRIGLTEVPVIDLGEITERQAKEIGLVDNGRYGHDDTLGLAKLLEEIGADVDVTTFMPMSEADLTGIFSSVTLSLDEIDMPDEEGEDAPRLADLIADSSSATPASTHQLMRFRVPHEDAEAIQKKIEKVMKTQGFTEADSLTNAGDALVHLLLSRGI